MAVYFPKIFSKEGNLEEIALKVRRLDMLCDEMILNKDLSDSIFEVEKEMLEHQKPNVWNVYHENNLERTLEVDFTKYAISVKEHVDFDLEKCTTFNFYASVEYITEKKKPKNSI